MSRITAELIDNVYDALSIMCLFSQRLSEGEITDIEAGDMAWLLGSTKRRLEPVINALERIENEERTNSAKESEAEPIQPAREYLSELLKHAHSETQCLAEVDKLLETCQALKASRAAVGNNGETRQ